MFFDRIQDSREGKSGMWDPVPDIIGIKREDAIKICSGDTAGFLAQIDDMSADERDKLILDLVPNLGTASRQQLDMIQALEHFGDLENEKRIREVLKSERNMSLFADELMQRFQK